MLPQRNEDLLETSGNLYCVRKVYKEQECTEKLRRELIYLKQTRVLSILVLYWNLQSLA